jgi:predicted Holliday junction resolvase-like endonuclease
MVVYPLVFHFSIIYDGIKSTGEAFMEIAVTIIIGIIVVVLAVIITNNIARSAWEKRYRAWQEEEMIKWQADLEQARKTAISQSRAVLGGKFTEQMVPYFPDFNYDPTEVRFIGSPIDMVVFPGLAQGNPEEIVILEIKTGKSVLTPVQKKIRTLIEEGMVRWDEVHADGYVNGETYE